MHLYSDSRTRPEKHDRPTDEGKKIRRLKKKLTYNNTIYPVKKFAWRTHKKAITVKTIFWSK